jgi:2-methylcitrate dehydratase PrpD
VEAAIALNPLVASKLREIDRILIETQESGHRIINKTGPLDNPADRDHCLQYMVAVPLIRGTLTADDYEDAAAADPLIDELRGKMEVVVNDRFSRDYLDPAKRSIGNAIQVRFRDGTATERVAVEYPIGHRSRRREGVPLLIEKFEQNVRRALPAEQAVAVFTLCEDVSRLHNTPVNEFMDLLQLPTADSIRK